MENHIRGLSSLGISKESYGTLLVPIILGKLTVATRKNLAQEHPNLVWSIDELQAAVLKETKILETGLYTNDHLSSVPANPSTPFTTASFYTGTKRSRTTTPSNGKKSVICVYCKGKHSSIVCDVVTDSQKRLDIIKGENLRFNCLGKFRCKNCKHKHHTNLCRPI